MRRVVTWEKVFSENETDGLSQLRKISNATCKRDMVFEREKNGKFEKS